MTLPLTRRLAEGRSGEEIAALTERIRAETRRLRAARAWPTPLDLATHHDRGIVRTPALDLVNRHLTASVAAPGGRLVVSIPPQEGKSTLLRWACAQVLLARPATRIVFASYASSLARTSGRIVRGLIDTHGAAWGLSVARDHADAADWQLAGHPGGMFCCGVGGALTGRPADLLIIDDPIRNAQDANSLTVLGNLHDWWDAVARTRLAPGASVVVVQTRWTEHDLAGRFGGEGWPVVNIPALADGHVPDALGRPVGEYLQSARGRTAEEWGQIHADVGERVWAALYQGAPAPPEGGIFLREWFSRDRVPERPSGAVPVVVVDPADNTGGGDEAGIVVASSDHRQHIHLGPDYSGVMTTARWVRVALLAAVRHQAATVAYEQSLSGLDRSVRHGWALLRKQASVLRRLTPGDWPDQPDPDVIEAATADLCHRDDPDTTRTTTRTELLELWPLVPAVLDYPDTGPSIRRILAKGSKELRAQLAAPLYEQRRVHHVGHLAALEHQMATWQPGQDSPDRMDAAVHAVMLLSGASKATLAKPAGAALPTRSTRLRTRGGAITRSTRR